MKYYLVGIKGTGMSHLASYLALGGDHVEGEDVEEDFSTRDIISSFRIFPLGSPLPDDVDVLVYSTGYGKRPPRAVDEALSRGIDVLTYPQMLARLSHDRITVGVSGTHGKSTTCAVASYLADKSALPAGTVYGSFLQHSHGTYHAGEKGLVLEACEYQDHFLLYDLDILVVTSIAYDHPDFFSDIADVHRSFRERIIRMPRCSLVIHHSSLSRHAKDWQSERPDIRFISYGPRGRFSLCDTPDDRWTVSGCTGAFSSAERSMEILYDHVAGLLACAALSAAIRGVDLDESSIAREADALIPLLSHFPGLTARGEVVLEEGGVTYVDDYAHHPDEMKVCIGNLRKRYPSRRLVVLFMPHTASRTKALMKDFVSVLSRCDAVFIQGVYASSRGDDDQSDESLRLFKALDRQVFRTFYGRLSSVFYRRSDDEAVESLSAFLEPGDVLVTLGAGDNRKLIGGIAQRRRCGLS